MQIIKLYINYLLRIPLEFILRWLEKRSHFGVLRFRLSRFIWSIMPGYPESRNKKLDFVLQYFPALKMTYWSKLSVLDIGCTGTMLMHELDNRKYRVAGLDIRPYQSKLPKDITFYHNDLLDPALTIKIRQRFHYVVAISTIELVADDRLALVNIHNLLLPNGYFILTLPTQHWRHIDGRGYSVKQFMNLISGLFNVFEMTQRGGHICAALVKV